jgi:ribose 5-phosphate isomerase B
MIVRGSLSEAWRSDANKRDGLFDVLGINSVDTRGVAHERRTVKVYIGSDHRGVEFKDQIKRIVSELGHEVCDMGAESSESSCDYPRVAYRVGTRVGASAVDRGILICMSGIGQSIAANKVKGVLAALCYHTDAARLSRQHNNANLLVLSAKFTPVDELPELIKVWLETAFEGGRHERRVDQIKQIESGTFTEE